MITREQVLKLQTDPEIFIKNILGENLPPYQARMARAIADNSRVAIAAAHDLGKSFILSRIVLWFGACFPGSKIITTAPTYLQVQSILWAEIRAAYARSKIPLGGQMNLTEWKLAPDWFAIGLTPKNEVTGGSGQGTASSFQGWHAPYILVVFDEATGIPSNIWNMAEGLMTSANVRFVAIGNPTSKGSEFFRCFKSPAWEKIYLSCFDSPNLIANGLTDIDALTAEVDLIRSLSEVEAKARMKSYLAPMPYLLSAQWVISSAIKWGFSHPLFVSKVLGKFPDEGDNVLIPLGVCEEARLRLNYPEESERRTLGVDVARFGTDSTVLTYLHGAKFITKKILVKRDTTQVAGEVIGLSQREGWPNVIVVDETGIGGGVVDTLVEAQKNNVIPRTVEIRGVQFGAACVFEEDRERYVNIKARMFDLLAKDLKLALSLPPDDVYLDELPTILYAYDSRGRMVIESKDDYKRRTGRSSPDHADSLALANFGRYDESRVGVFGDSLFETSAPLASGLRSGDTW